MIDTIILSFSLVLLSKSSAVVRYYQGHWNFSRLHEESNANQFLCVNGNAYVLAHVLINVRAHDHRHAYVYAYNNRAQFYQIWRIFYTKHFPNPSIFGSST